MLTVIAYDIAEDRRRAQVSTLLEDYGVRVNYSVFECELSGAEFTQVCAQLLALIDRREDRILLYRLCEGCRPRKATLGRPGEEPERSRVVIV